MGEEAAAAAMPVVHHSRSLVAVDTVLVFEAVEEGVVGEVAAASSDHAQAGGCVGSARQALGVVEEALGPDALMMALERMKHFQILALSVAILLVGEARVEELAVREHYAAAALIALEVLWRRLPAVQRRSRTRSISTPTSVL